MDIWARASCLEGAASAKALGREQSQRISGIAGGPVGLEPGEDEESGLGRAVRMDRKGVES